jgi:pyruvate dehydrogenase E1 component alpha subunit
MLRIRDLERKQARLQKTTISREALLAATSIHLLPGDLLSARIDDLTAAQLAPSGKLRAGEKKPRTAGTLPPVSAIRTRLALCAAAARGLQSAGTDGLVLAFSHASAIEPDWLPTLEWALQAQLPLLLACTDPTSGLGKDSTKKAAPTLDYATLSRLSTRIKLPIVTVDGVDAVAVYRVMQESVIRARMGGGPAVIWAMMPGGSTKLPRSAQPIARLEQYLTARKISFIT